MKKHNIYILGNFGYQTGILDGQRMESRSILKLLELYNVSNITYFDTEDLRIDKFSAFKMMYKITQTKHLYYLGAQGSLKYVFPFIWLLSKLFGVKIHYLVVGGWIAEFIKKMPFHRFLLRRTNGLFCETHSMVEKLTNWYGFKHVYWLPNFRVYDFEPVIKRNDDGPLKLVFMSRIVKSKGIMRVFNLGNYLKENSLDKLVQIDFYGPLYENEKTDFFEGIEKFEFMEYKGVLQPEDIYKTLVEYDAMLFPTNYPGEGFPGTVLDSYISGIPIVASDWRYNSELIIHGKTGFLFPLDKENLFYEYITKLIKDRDLLFEMKKNAFEKSKDFNIGTVFNILTKYTGI